MPMFACCDNDETPPIYYVTPDLQSSYPGSIFESETETSMSGMTIESIEVPGYFVQHHGRQHTANESAMRWYPSDNIKRYILRHISTMWAFGSRYSGMVQEMLAFVPGQQRHALELGTGIGTWIQEVATEFPHVQFRSLDLTPIIAHPPRRNIVFEVYDFVKGLLLEDNSQDVVFLSYLSEIVIDYRPVLREAHRVLRPGGLIHIREYNPHLWDPRDMSKVARDTNPIGCQFFDFIRAGLTKSGVDLDMCHKFPEWLAPGSDIWEHGSKTGGFEKIESIVRTRPTYPHEGFPCMDQMDSQTASFLRHMTLTSARENSGMLRDGGVEAGEDKRIIEEMIEEAKDPRKCTLMKLHCVYATKMSA